MVLDGVDLRALAVATLREPQTAARRLLDWAPPAGARWMALVLAAVLSVLLSLLIEPLLPSGEAHPLAALMGNAWTGVPLQLLSLLFLAGLMTAVGTTQGAKGRFIDAVLLVTWLQLMMLGAQLVQIVALVLLPPVGLLLSFAIFAIFLWVLTRFTMALHGLASAAKTFGALLLGFLLAAVILALALQALGLGIPATGAAHV